MLKTENIRKMCGKRRHDITLAGTSCRFLFWDILLLKIGSKVTMARKLMAPPSFLENRPGILKKDVKLLLHFKATNLLKSL